ncbi:rhamnan synthesis F family protein [Francisella philomiragia]|uniref:rhamnan synthesis F family protein n=1 Tax=Francisella philomiragia TaxID=28110 RepID=UPI0019081012|nr:rhamnan synthesis F family protein [Francisella philomiragia]MBK2105429.1 glycosyltransferase [Francisella philomiragia]
MIKKIASHIFPIGSSRREFISKIYRSFKPRSPQDAIQHLFIKGNKNFNDSKETIVLVSHESSATGAPLLGLCIGKALSHKYNLIHYVMRKCEIHNSFLEDSFLLIEDYFGSNNQKAIIDELNQKYCIKIVIANSIVTYPVLKAASNIKIPTLSLVHEFAGFVESGEVMINNIIAADRVIAPSLIVRNSILEELQKSLKITTIPSNITIKAQGKLPFIPDTYGDIDSPEQILNKIGLKKKGDYKIIVAAGSISMRKGVDLFISIARYIRNNYKGKYKFVWVGGGLDERDYIYSYWLKRDIKQFDLSEDFVFLGHQQNLDSIFSIADIFCLTSRMDPFPNVAIDALEANLPIACFKDATGTVEFLEKYNADAIIADYLDIAQISFGMVNYLNKNTEKSHINKAIVEKYLDFNLYINFLIEQINICEKENFQNLRILEELEKFEIFSTNSLEILSTENTNFHYINSTLDFIRAQRKGLYRATPNPYPGFCTHKWLIENDCESNVAIYDAIKQGALYTHKCHKLPIDNVSYNSNLKVAIHLHLFYIDLADEFNAYFQQLPSGFDLYITIIDSDDIETIKNAFETSGAKNIKVVIVDNIGRDVAPMIFDLKDDVLNGGYDVVGHFHSKKSMSVSNDTGGRWRKYLLDNLIGDKGVANSILSIFNDEKIGLVFPEDRHYMDIGTNKEYIDSLCQVMRLNQINETPLFPLGNMFWARVDAIKDMFELDKNIVIQEEPLPYDGSFMHALERITPTLVEKNGYNYVTVYKNGTSW